MPEPVDLTLAVHAGTFRAILVSDTGEASRAAWLPRSKIEIEHTGKLTQGTRSDGQIVDLAVIEARVPEWLAKDKGLI